MKKGLIISSTLALLLGIGVAAGASQQKVERASAATDNTAFFLRPNSNWQEIAYGTNPRYAAYFYKNGGDTWSSMVETAVAGTYKVSIPATYTNVIFCRMRADNGHSENSWANKMNQTGDLTISGNEGKLFTVPDGWDVGTDSNWSSEMYNDPVSYTITTHVRGVTTSNVEVAENTLPATPSLQYGEASFVGWFDNEACSEGHEVAAVTANGMNLYAKITSVPTVSYTIQFNDGTGFGNNLNLYAFESGDRKNADWPGVAISNKTITSVPTDATFIINDGTKQTVDVEQLAEPVNNDVLIVLNEQEGGKYKTLWQSTIDEPAEDGYYLVGSKTNNKYKNAVKMLAGEQVLLGNDAEYYGYEGKENETLKVRQFVRSEGKDEWSFFKENEYSTGIGEADESGNLKFLKDETIDIFAKWEEETPDHWQINFYISKHAERHEVAITNVFFNGKVKTDTSDRPATIATEGGNFEPGEYNVLGYVQRGYYTNEACTTAYTPAEVTTDDVHLYCKYTKLGYYITGDAAFSGSEGDAWKVDGAAYLTTEVNDTVNNLFEGTIVIPAGASEEHPVQVRPAEYVGPGADGWNWNIPYSISDYDFAKKVGDNIEFTESGTFAIYVSKSYVVYINKGLAAFNTKFITDIGGVCNDQGNTNLVTLKAMWAEEKLAYNSLSAEEKLEYTSKTIDSGNEKGSDLEKVIAKYSYIVHKYGTTNFEDFIWGGTYTGTSEVLATYQAPENNGVLAVLIIVSTFAAIGVGVLVLTKKKHE